MNSHRNSWTNFSRISCTDFSTNFALIRMNFMHEKLAMLRWSVLYLLVIFVIICLLAIIRIIYLLKTFLCCLGLVLILVYCYISDAETGKTLFYTNITFMNRLAEDVKVEWNNGYRTGEVLMEFLSMHNQMIVTKISKS